MLGNQQKGGLNTSQYDFKGVAVIFILFRQDPHQAHISQLLLGQAAMLGLQQVGQFPIEA